MNAPLETPAISAQNAVAEKGLPGSRHVMGKTDTPWSPYLLTGIEHLLAGRAYARPNVIDSCRRRRRDGPIRLDHRSTVVSLRAICSQCQRSAAGDDQGRANCHMRASNAIIGWPSRLLSGSTRPIVSAAPEFLRDAQAIPNNSMLF